MQETTSREKILKKIRRALVSRGNSFYLNADFESPVFKEENEAPEIVFASRFTELHGNFIFCVDEQEAFQQLKDLFATKEWGKAVCKEEEVFYFLNAAGIPTVADIEDEGFNVAVTLCECVVARSGSFFLSSKQQIGRKFAVNNDVHIVIAFSSQIVNTVEDGFQFIKTKYENKFPSMVTLVSGPSKTADIEQTLVYGAHGPAELYFFLVEG
jgi:L-lactate dehydrogenase complex protein LldG